MTKSIHLDKSVKIFLRKEYKSYLETIDILTAEEKKDLHEWVTSGNSVYDNPYCISDDSGRPMDYISAIRVNLDMLAGEMGPVHEALIEAEQKWDVETDPLF